MMLRLRPTNTDSDQSWNETFTIIKDNPGCCDEVWFSTGMGYLPEEWHEDKVERISKAMAQLAQIGVSSSLQFQMTIGHGDKFGVGNEGKKPLQSEQAEPSPLTYAPPYLDATPREDSPFRLRTRPHHSSLDFP